MNLGISLALVLQNTLIHTCIEGVHIPEQILVYSHLLNTACKFCVYREIYCQGIYCGVNEPRDQPSSSSTKHLHI